MTEYLTEIPSKIKPKVSDLDWSKTFKFEEIPCTHKPTDPEYTKEECLKCKCDKAEKWLEDELTKMQGTETIKAADGVTNLTIQKIEVKRGRFDDCQGIQCEWK